MVIKTKIKLTEDRPLKGARSFRSRSAGPKGPFLLFRSFRSSAFRHQGSLKMLSVFRSSSPLCGLRVQQNVANGTARRCHL